MKKFKFIVALTSIFLLILCLVACFSEPTELLPDNAEKISIPTGNYDFLSDMLIALDQQDTIDLTYTISEYGMYMTNFKGSKIELSEESVSSTYLSFYINTDDANYIDTTITPVVFNDVTYYAAGTGVSSTPIISEATYLFCTVTYGEDWTSTVNEQFIILE